MKLVKDSDTIEVELGRDGSWAPVSSKSPPCTHTCTHTHTQPVLLIRILLFSFQRENKWM